MASLPNLPAETSFLTSLTASNTQSLPNGTLGNDRIIKFVASQSRYSKDHANEGMAFRESWDAPVKKSTPPPHLQSVWVSGFETPVLKPRVPAAKLDATLSSAPVPLRHLSTPASSVSRRSSSRKPASLKKQNPSTIMAMESKKAKLMASQGQCKSKKRADQGTGMVKPRASAKRRRSLVMSDSEHAQRLAERRERKRSRKALAKPPSSDLASSAVEKGNNSDEENSRKAKKRDSAKASRVPKLAAGLALMHGFTSTNIGKHRLTLNPSSRYGVFNKGKASSKAKVGASSKSKVRASNLFSEDKFLGSVKSKSIQCLPPTRHDSRTRIRASPSFSGTSSSKSDRSLPAVKVISRPITVKGRPNNKATPVRAPSPVSEDAGSDVQHSSGTTSSIVKSETWDIESGRRSLPAGSGVSHSGETSKVGTAVLDVRHLPWSHALKIPDASLDAKKNTTLNTDVSSSPSLPSLPRTHSSQTPHASDDVKTFSPDAHQRLGRASSLGPWESASQVVQRGGMAFSKYFERSTINNSRPPRRDPVDPSKDQGVVHGHTPAPSRDNENLLPSAIQQLQAKSVPSSPPDLHLPTSTEHELCDAPVPSPVQVSSVDLPVPVEHPPRRASSTMSSSSSLDRALEELGAEDPSLAFASQPSRTWNSFRHMHADLYDHNSFLEDIANTSSHHGEPPFDSGAYPASVYDVDASQANEYLFDADLRTSDPRLGYPSSDGTGRFLYPDGFQASGNAFNATDDPMEMPWEDDSGYTAFALEEASTAPLSLNTSEMVTSLPPEDDTFVDREDFDGSSGSMTGVESVDMDMDTDTEVGVGEYTPGYTFPIRNHRSRFEATTFDNLEEEMARTLKHHWLPQKL